MNEEIIKAFKHITEDILDVFHIVLESKVGINPKVGINTLEGSNLEKEAQTYSHAPFIYLVVNNYIDDIEKGKRPKSELVPIQALRQWAKRKGIKTDNKTLHIIQYAIWRDGIKRRPIITQLLRTLEDEWNEKYSNMLFETIYNNLVKIFNEKWK